MPCACYFFEICTHQCCSVMSRKGDWYCTNEKFVPIAGSVHNLLALHLKWCPVSLNNFVHWLVSALGVLGFAWHSTKVRCSFLWTVATNILYWGPILCRHPCHSDKQSLLADLHKMLFDCVAGLAKLHEIVMCPVRSGLACLSLRSSILYECRCLSRRAKKKVQSMSWLLVMFSARAEVQKEDGIAVKSFCADHVYYTSQGMCQSRPDGEGRESRGGHEGYGHPSRQILLQSDLGGICTAATMEAGMDVWSVFLPVVSGLNLALKTVPDEICLIISSGEFLCRVPCLWTEGSSYEIMQICTLEHFLTSLVHPKWKQISSLKFAGAQVKYFIFNVSFGGDGNCVYLGMVYMSDWFVDAGFRGDGEHGSWACSARHLLVLITCEVSSQAAPGLLECTHLNLLAKMDGWTCTDRRFSVVAFVPAWPDNLHVQRLCTSRQTQASWKGNATNARARDNPECSGKILSKSSVHCCLSTACACPQLCDVLPWGGGHALWVAALLLSQNSEIGIYRFSALWCLAMGMRACTSKLRNYWKICRNRESKQMSIRTQALQRPLSMLVSGPHIGATTRLLAFCFASTCF